MNSAVRAALRPGGRYVVIDHSALPGHADRDVETLHRVEESLVRAEIERAGFRLVAEGSFLREPGDTRDWNAAPRAATRLGRRGSSDRFVLAFEPAPGGASP
jgi:predicted methyltransferase